MKLHDHSFRNARREAGICHHERRYVVASPRRTAGDKRRARRAARRFGALLLRSEA